MTPQDSTQALVSTGVSGLAATTAAANLQPVLTNISIIIACISGSLASIYYIIHIIKKLKEK